MNNYKTEGIIIKRTNSGEADRSLTILTSYHGKLRAIAKGSRKITSKRAPSLELFTQTSLVIHHGRTGEYISEAKAIHSFEHIRQDLQKVKEAYQLAELTNLLTREDQELDGVYDLLSVSFHRINDGMSFSLHDFKLRLLFLLGFANEKTQEYDIDSYIEEIGGRRLLTKRLYE